MLLNFAEALQDPRIGGPGGIIRLSNAARSPASYMLATILPERDINDYTARGGSMIVRSTMAGAVGLDSKFPEGGVMEISAFMESIAKIAIANHLTEAVIRELQNAAKEILLAGDTTTDLAVNTILNFVNKLLLQPHYDRREWLRSQALFTNGINWQFNGVDLQVSYGVPTSNIFATRTGTAAYEGSASAFWTDWKAARKILGDSFRGALCDRATADSIIYNPVNKILITGDEGGVVQFVRYLGAEDGFRPQSLDARERGSIIVYDKEGEVIDLTLATKNKTKKVQIGAVRGTLGFFGSDDRSAEFIVGEGATPDPENERALGYTHIGPTVEGGGTGVWSRVFVPEGMPMHLRGESTENVLPVIQNPKKIVLASTTVS